MKNSLWEILLEDAELTHKNVRIIIEKIAEALVMNLGRNSWENPILQEKPLDKFYEEGNHGKNFVSNHLESEEIQGENRRISRESSG